MLTPFWCQLENGLKLLILVSYIAYAQNCSFSKESSTFKILKTEYIELFFTGHGFSMFDQFPFRRMGFSKENCPNYPFLKIVELVGWS